MKPNNKNVIKKRTEENRKKAIELYRQGFSYRQIQKKLGYKSHASIQQLLKEEIKKVAGIIKINEPKK